MTDETEPPYTKEILDMFHGLGTYQAKACSTAGPARDGVDKLFEGIEGNTKNVRQLHLLVALSYGTAGLANEAGEVLGKYKKLIRDKGGAVTYEFSEVLKAELGDVLWYLAFICNTIGINLGDVALYNLNKLAARQAAGTIQGDGDNR